MKQALYLLFIILFITSCDCYQITEGFVLDKDTNKPIIGATLYIKNKEWNKVLTDSVGHFELSNISGGFTCPPMNIVVECKEYKTYKAEIPSGRERVIYLEK